jgi:hypothetical protein
MAGTIMHAKSWKMGVLFSETGVTAASESTQRAATLLAIDQINAKGSILGRPIAAIEFDPASGPKMYKLYRRETLRCRCSGYLRLSYVEHPQSGVTDHRSTRRAARACQTSAQKELKPDISKVRICPSL